MENPNNIVFTSHLSLPKRILTTFLRTFFNLLYHQFAWTYDWVAAIVSLGAWKQWIQSVTPYLVGPKILEVGFGPGHLQAAILQKGLSIYGIDESVQMVGITRHRLKKLGFLPYLIRGKAEHLPFIAESFNQVVMTFPAEFLFKKGTYLEIGRILAEGGTIFILPVAWITGRKPLERVAAWFNRVTGEAPQWDEKFLEPLKSLGFEVQWEMLTFKASKALLIRMTKHQDISHD